MNLILGSAQMVPNYGLSRRGQMGAREFGFLMRLAEEKGFKAIDTAPSYGKAEESVGDSGVSFSVHSKFHPDISPEQSIIQTLAKTQREKIEIAYFHDPRVCVDSPSTVEEAAALAGEKFDLLGSSIYEIDEFEASLDDPRIGVVQVPINPLDRRFTSERLKRANQACTKVIARSVFLQGCLLALPEHLTERTRHLSPYVRRVHDIAADFDLPPIVLLLGWLRTIQGLHGIVIGIDSTQDLEEICRSLEAPCPSEAVGIVEAMEIPPWSDVDPRRWR